MTAPTRRPDTPPPPPTIPTRTRTRPSRSRSRSPGIGGAVLAAAVAIVAPGAVGPARAQVIVRPPAARPTATPAPPTTVRSFATTPAAGATVAPDRPDYRVSGYGTSYGATAAGAAAYAGYRGFPRYGYASPYGSPAYGYGAFAASYGFPGYNRIAPTYAYRGYQGSYYGPGLTPNVGDGPGYASRGVAAYAPLGGR